MGELLKIISTHIPDLMMVKTRPKTDKRGTFSRIFCEKELKSVIGDRRILQINHSQTAQVGTVRGLHFQHPPHSEMKLIRWIKGEIWDVAVDLRAHSKTFRHWHAVQLSPSNNYMMVIPEGFAHGFQCLEAESELLYLHTSFYNYEAEGGINYRDPCLNINWPLPVVDLSPRDAHHGFMKQDYQGIIL